MADSFGRSPPLRKSEPELDFMSGGNTEDFGAGKHF
jgi:hypothetical protein